VTRQVIDEKMWAKLEPFFERKKAGRPPKDNRLFVEAICWIIRTGAPWRDLPPSFGSWKTTYNRYNRFVKNKKFDQIFEVLKKRWRSRMAHD
jgi:transposase